MAERVCRCLLREAESTRPLFELVKEYIDALPDEQKANETIYQQRLALCKDCAELRNGTCVLCGCYVEMRAAKKRMNCPMVPARWTAE